MYLYKYFRNEAHMQDFLNGYVRFKSLLSYKSTEEEKGNMVDDMEGETEVNLSPKKHSITIANYHIPEEDFAGPIKLKFGKQLTRNYFIFCSSTSKTFKETGYDYYVKFCLKDFNYKLKKLFLDAREYDGHNQGIVGIVMPIHNDLITQFTPDIDGDRAIRAFNKDFEHKKIIYYADTEFLALLQDPLFSKRRKYSMQAEYRHAFLVDYYKLSQESNNSFNLKFIQPNEQNDADEKLLQQIIIPLHLGKINSNEFGKITK